MAIHKEKINPEDDLGFGTQPVIKSQPVINKDGSINVKRTGLPFLTTSNNYHSLITMSWRKFWVIVFSAYFVVNIIFALIYVSLGPDVLDGKSGNTDFDRFMDAFFFSAQTISTVGYGHISPRGMIPNTIAALESMMGLLAFALATGLLYGRFSRPSAKIMYSRNVLIAPYRDGKGLMFRLANERRNILIDLEMEVVFSYNDEELREQYLNIINDGDFKAEFDDLLKNYVGRPSPLYHAKRYSEKYGANIFFKREDLNHTGSHKINNAIGQILLAKRLGKKRIIAETGAGQHGVATATVCALMNIECVVYMGAIDMVRQAPNVARMKMLGAKVVPATSGSQTLKDATNEALRDWIGNPVDTHYIIGSVVGPYPYPDIVARFQSIISQETKAQLLEQTGNELPQYVLACVGGGSNAMGMFYHFIDDEAVKLVAVEAAGKGVNSGESAATTALGDEGVLHGSRTILMQTEDGQVVEPYSISAGLDYPGIGPQHAHLFKTGRGQYVSITDEEALQAGLLCCQLEGIIPAIETAHALAQLEKMKFEANDTVVICISGRGDKDLDTYINYFGY
jgi:tryptophan synthase beta subunit